MIQSLCSVFSRAAEKLHLSQPTLSRQLKDLEDEFGKQLLIREPRRILLTDDGALLRRRAEEILSLVEKTEGELLSSNEDISGDIRSGAGESVHFVLEKEPGLFQSLSAVSANLAGKICHTIRRALQPSTNNSIFLLNPINHL